MIKGLRSGILLKGCSALVLLLAAHASYAAGKAGSEDPNEGLSAECIQMREDLDADLAKQNAMGCPPSLAQMSRLMDNPIGNVAMLFTQFDFYRMTNENVTDESANKTVYTGIAQFPKKLTENWNLINRVVWTVPSMPLDQDKIDAATGQSDPFGEFQGNTLPPGGGALPINVFDGRTTGFGDMYYVGLFSPNEAPDLWNGKFLWGLGFDMGFPTATSDILGTGKWTAGPSALGAYMGPTWKVGLLLQQYWDYAGFDDRDNVSLMNLQYFLQYTLNETTSIGVTPNIIANWEQDSSNRWTVPIGLGINKTFQFGKLPVRIGIEAHYSVIQPDDVPGAEWDVRVFFIPAVPSFMFEWMN